jgi:hypothetical protein
VAFLIIQDIIDFFFRLNHLVIEDARCIILLVVIVKVIKIRK